MCRKGNFLLLIAGLMVSLGVAWGQGAVGTLNGTVLDAAGAVVPGASVVAINNDTKVESRTTTTSSGAYTLPYLPQGPYTVRVTAAGFRTSTADNVILRAAQILGVNITLEVGQVNEQVTVSDTPPVLESGTAEIGRYIIGRSTRAGPSSWTTGSARFRSFIFDSLPGTTGGTFEGSINGGQEYSHEILIEGIPVGRADLSGGNNNEISPSVDAIGEFKLQTGAVSAQYNGGQTAVANFSIKSGTNELHGGLFGMQNEGFNSDNLTTETQGNPKPIHRENRGAFSAARYIFRSSTTGETRPFVLRITKRTTTAT